MYQQIAERLKLPAAKGSNDEARVAVLDRFQTSVHAKLRGKNKQPLPMTILVIDEIDLAPRQTVREIMNLAEMGREEITSSGTIIHNGSNSYIDGGSVCIDGVMMPLWHCSSSSSSSSSQPRPTLPSSVIVIGMANSISFPEDCGVSFFATPEMILFETYSKEQLIDIVLSRTLGMFDDQAMMLVAALVSRKGGRCLYFYIY
jgi:Cdc6-like AAA superfamily ATPase